jgi:hypothetical protein
MNKDYRLCAAVLDWFAVQRIWRKSSETAASQTAHDSLDDFIKQQIPQATKPTK